jgi:cellulose synthase/poly-beta-1,6-N-acetylglucosamine synthase-like glycosyltransferase
MSPPEIPLDPTVRRFVRRHHPECAAVTLSGGQALRALLLLAALFVLFCWDWKVFAAGALFAVAAFYVCTVGAKLLVVGLSLLRRPEMRIPPEELAALAEADLPVYTILMPLYREEAVAATLVRAVACLDYPAEKLDVKILLEADDEATIRQVRALDLPACVEPLVVPDAPPKTKPRACNHGLETARGEFLVIYDAEDRPEPDQLRKAVAAFRRLGPESRVVCLQAKLNYYNPDQNLLTKWFALEYTAWFDLFLPGLHELGIPIPLGGTSNHFRTARLREVGGWDPFNLTEDCDLGIRLHRRGWRTRVLDSTTWEEANSRLGNWIRQRSRWVKGYIQTHCVHGRRWLRTLRELGPAGTAGFLLTVGGLSATLLLNPFFWVTGGIYLGLHIGHAAGWTPAPWPLRYYDRVSDIPGAPYTTWSELSWVFYGAAVSLAAANLFFIGVNLLAVARRRLWRLVPEALLSPLYWVLISCAAWKGFLQLFVRPFYWEKTAHGFAEAGTDPGETCPVRLAPAAEGERGPGEEAAP